MSTGNWEKLLMNHDKISHNGKRSSNKEITMTTTKKRGNPNPVRNKEFYDNQFKHVAPCEEKLGKKPFGVRLPEDVTEKLDQMPRADRIRIMRDAVTLAVRALED